MPRQAEYLSPDLSALTEVSSLCTKYASLFKDELGTVSLHKAVLQVHLETIPKFCKAHPVPFAIKEVTGQAGMCWDFEEGEPRCLGCSNCCSSQER